MEPKIFPKAAGFYCGSKPCPLECSTLALLLSVYSNIF